MSDITPIDGPRPRQIARGHPASIRRRLALTLMASTGLLWVVITIYGLHGVRHQAREIGDAQLSLAGQVLLNMLIHEIDEGYPDPSYAIGNLVPDIFPASRPPHVDSPVFVVRDASKRLLLHSSAAKPLLKDLKQPLSSGLYDLVLGDTSWRVSVLQDAETGLWIAAAHPSRLQEELALELAYNFIAPLLLALPLLGIIIHVAVKHGLDSLKRLTTKVSSRSVTDTSPLTDAEVPIEALSLTQALDDLLERLEQSHRREQRFIADATHELRTPLAGLKVQAQVARGATDHHQRTEALESLTLGVDRATRLVTQLLTLARLDHHTRRDTSKPLELLEVVRELCVEIAPSAIDADIELTLIGAEHCMVSAERTLLAVLIRNLIENAIQYGGSGKQITVSVHCTEQYAIVSVRDQGPGIPPQDLNRVFERFYRGTNQHAPGSGLGLSIVKGIADHCDAKVKLSNHDKGGLSIAVKFKRV